MKKNPVQRASFKNTCIVMGWDFNSFEEKYADYSIRADGYKNKRYTYKQIKKGE